MTPNTAVNRTTKRTARGAAGGLWRGSGLWRGIGNPFDLRTTTKQTNISLLAYNPTDIPSTGYKVPDIRR